MKVAPSIRHSLSIPSLHYCHHDSFSIHVLVIGELFQLSFLNLLLWFFQVWVIITCDHHLVWVIVVMPCGSCCLLLCCMDVHELVDRCRENVGDFNLAQWATWSFYMSNNCVVVFDSFRSLSWQLFPSCIVIYFYPHNTYVLKSITYLPTCLDLHFWTHNLLEPRLCKELIGFFYTW